MSKPIFRRDKPHDHPMTKEGTPLQRYDPIRYSDQGGWSWDTASIKPCDDGEYVKFDDVEAERSALLREVEKLKEATRWIPVSERLPEETFTGLVPSTLVLCFGKGGRWFTAIFADGYFADVDGNDCDFVTHWMPLPTPPEP